MATSTDQPPTKTISNYQLTQPLNTTSNYQLTQPLNTTLDEQQPIKTLSKENVEPSNRGRCFLLIAVLVQLVCSLAHAALVGFAIQHCGTTRFASYSIIGAGLLVILTFAACVASYVKSKISVSVKIEIVTCLVALGLIIYESLTIKCTTPTSSMDEFCGNFRKSGNICDRTDEQEANIPEDPFKAFRMIILCVALLNLCCGFAAFVVFLISYKAGNPVYLSKKRHRTSIVVGDSTNSVTAFTNRLKNVEENCVATNDEVQQYDKKREECENRKKSSASRKQSKIENGKTSIMQPKQSILMKQLLEEKSPKSDKESRYMQQAKSVKQTSNVQVSIQQSKIQPKAEKSKK